MASNDESKTSSSALFQPSPSQRLSGLERVVLVLTMVLFFGGIYLMGAAFGDHDYGLEVFSAGLAALAFGLWLSYGWLPGRNNK